jgi:hypothetical protein
MKNLFNSIRKSVSTFIAPSCIKVDVPAGATSLTIPNLPRHMAEQRPHTTEYSGQFHVDSLELLGSQMLKDAIAQLGAWSALARAFSSYEKAHNNKRANQDEYRSLIEEMHCWNAATSIGKQMGDDDIALALHKISQVKPQKGNKDTDAIIADIRKCSIKELHAKREAAAKEQSAKREELLTAFMAEAVHCTGTDMNPSLPHAKVAMKVVQTLDWIASKDDWSPEFVAAECLLIRADLATIEQASKKEQNNSTFVEGMLASDGLVRNAIAGRKYGEERNEVERPLNPTISPEDAAAFAEWQAAQHA